MNKQERAYQTLRERILNGAYGPGYRLVIDALAEEFGVSALPVREAIRRLEAEGLIVFRPNAGAQVAPADPSLYEEELSVLAVLEGYATALAAAEMEPSDVERLKEFTNQMVECMNTLDALGFGRMNQAFHLAIYECCPNPYLVELLRETGRRLDAIRRTVFTQIPYRGWESIEEHRALIELIESGAHSKKIEAAAREHKLATAAAFRRWRDEHELTPAGAADAGDGS
jgi:DNA-binding GntR family transcriptional regulator